jgi:hypothetical protein
MKGGTPMELEKLTVSIVLMILLTAFTVACKNQEETNSVAFDETTQLMESATESVQATIEDHTDGAYSFYNPNRYERFVKPVLNEVLPEAVANSSCLRPAASSCNSGVKEAIYNNCALGSSGATYSGEAALSYSDSSCQLLSSGDHVTRTYDISFTGRRGLLVVNFTSDAGQNYLGETHVGGGRLTKTNAGWEIDVLGRNQSVVFNGRQVADHSIKTTSPIQVTGSLSRAGRVIDGGELVVSHNLAQYKAIFTPNNLQYSGTCCHPVSGSLSVQYEGSRTGSATLTFNGCGSAQYQKDNLIKDITLSYCH